MLACRCNAARVWVWAWRIDRAVRWLSGKEEANMKDQPPKNSPGEEDSPSLQSLESARRWSRVIQSVLWGMFLIVLGLFLFLVWLWWFRDGTTADRNSVIFLALVGIHLFLSACTASVSRHVLEHKKHAERHAEECRKTELSPPLSG